MTERNDTTMSVLKETRDLFGVIKWLTRAARMEDVLRPLAKFKLDGLTMEPRAGDFALFSGVIPCRIDPTFYGKPVNMFLCEIQEWDGTYADVYIHCVGEQVVAKRHELTILR